MVEGKGICIEDIVEGHKMVGSFIGEGGNTEIIGLELKKEGEDLIFAPHKYVNKEPDTKFLYHQIKKIAAMLGITINLAPSICSDEENGLERNKRGFYFSKVFADSGSIGPNVFKQAAHVSEKEGHSSNVSLLTGHIGMYKNNDGRILLGKVESERDGVFRPTCGALYHVMNRFLGKEKPPKKVDEWDTDLIGKLGYGLSPFKEDIVKAYNSGIDEPEKHSLGMQLITRKHVDVQTQRLVELHSESKLEEPKLVFGAITFNRFKYPDTTVLTHAYLLKGGEVYDLTKTPVQNGNRR